jgi:hypothetical protein
MAASGERLASAFAEAYLPVFDFVEKIDDAGWTSFVEAEGSTVAAVMNHVAQAMRYNGAVLKAVREGYEPVALTQENIDAFNQAEKKSAGVPSREEVLAAMRNGVERIGASLAALPDEAFSRPITIAVGDHTVASLNEWVETIALPHGRQHVAGCRPSSETSGPSAS